MPFALSKAQSQKVNSGSPSSLLRVRGGKPLKGTVIVRGAKNSIPKNLVATLLTREKCILKNVPDIQDVEIVSEMISALGGQVTYLGDGVMEIENKELRPLSPEKLQEFAGKSRIPILLCGPLLARTGEVVVPTLGGCEIGARPVDFHISALKQLGAKTEELQYGLRLTATKLKGTKIRLPYPSVGATEQILLTAVYAHGVTELSNAAIEPEIIDLIALLQKMGAIISVETDRVIRINGVQTLHGFTHSAMSDRLETASWACAALVTDGRIEVRNAIQIDMMTFLNKFRQVGGEFEVTESGITFWRDDKKKLNSIPLETGVHPGFMTDWQQPFVLVLTQAQGVSIVHETVYEDRFGYVSTLNRMGAQIQLYQECLGSMNCRFGQQNILHSAAVLGPTPLKGIEMTIPDLRAGFCYVIAALVAEGVSTLRNIRLIRRGYERFYEKLGNLGADFDILEDDISK